MNYDIKEQRFISLQALLEELEIIGEEQVVDYKNVVWQRQGNSTRSITGTDLRLIRKKEKESIGMAQVACILLFAGEEEYEV